MRVPSSFPLLLVVCLVLLSLSSNFSGRVDAQMTSLSITCDGKTTTKSIKSSTKEIEVKMQPISSTTTSSSATSGTSTSTSGTSTSSGSTSTNDQDPTTTSSTTSTSSTAPTFGTTTIPGFAFVTLTGITLNPTKCSMMTDLGVTTSSSTIQASMTNELPCSGHIPNTMDYMIRVMDTCTKKVYNINFEGPDSDGDADDVVLNLGDGTSDPGQTQGGGENKSWTAMWIAFAIVGVAAVVVAGVVYIRVKERDMEFRMYQNKITAATCISATPAHTSFTEMSQI